MIRFVLGTVLIVGCIVALWMRRTAKQALASESADRTQVQYYRAKASSTSIAAFITAFLGISLLVASCVRIVPANNVGIPTQFGAVGAPMQAGFNVTAPWTKVTKFTTRIQELSMLRAADEGDKGKDDSIQVIAKGGGSMSVDLTVRYSIDKNEASELFRQAGSMELVKDRFVRPDAREVARNIFGLYTAEEGYSSARAEISAKIFDDLKPRLAGRGIILDSVNIRDVQPEGRVLEAINGILGARNEALKAAETQKQQTTEAETRKKVAELDKEATVTKAEAEADSTRIRAEAEAAANTAINASLTPELVALQIAQACAEAIANTNAAVINGCSSSNASGVADTNGANASVIVDARAPSAPSQNG